MKSKQIPSVTFYCDGIKAWATHNVAYDESSEDQKRIFTECITKLNNYKPKLIKGE